MTNLNAECGMRNAEPDSAREELTAPVAAGPNPSPKPSPLMGRGNGQIPNSKLRVPSSNPDESGTFGAIRFRRARRRARDLPQYNRLIRLRIMSRTPLALKIPGILILFVFLPYGFANAASSPRERISLND